MLRAVIFDFNGIIVDDEPIHFRLFQRVLGEEGIHLMQEDYYARYLGFDDKGAFSAAYRENDRDLSAGKLAELISRKAAYYQEAIQSDLAIFPGVRQLVSALTPHVALAVASGALRQEITSILRGAGLLPAFRVIVAAEDVERGKPAPDIFLAALARLNAAMAPQTVNASECVVIEDSKEGVKGARRAGMTCLAVTNSHPAELLRDAHAVVTSLAEVDVGFLRALCA